MGPKLYRVTIFFGSDVLRLATEDYMLFGWNSCARCLTRTLGSIEFFLTQVNTVQIWAPSKIVILDGAQTLSGTNLLWLRVSKLARASNNRILCDSGQQLRISAPSKITLLDTAPTFFSNHVVCFTCSTIESWTLHNSLQPSCLLPCGWVSSALPCMFPSSAHLFPHSYDL